MSKRMLIDATHAEETRVVVMDGNRLEDYDVEAVSRKKLKGNIYLARVVRIEPSLQAAFVEYGGNRHGFLPFNEIHPDYYQIPVADREKLLAFQTEAEEDFIDTGCSEQPLPCLEDASYLLSDNVDNHNFDTLDPIHEAEKADEIDESETDEEVLYTQPQPDCVGGETDTGEESLIQRRIARFLRNYRIQEVIRRRQIILVQVVKEERGNKGTALTTYISLAGRYCVLMPNTLRHGGVSRKITSVADRRRLRDIIANLTLPKGMAMIVRTAGAQQPESEIIRDYEYLIHLWDDIREFTLKSIAPAFIYEEASLIRRAIRDMYTHEISEIIVDGENGWKAAHDFMRILVPQCADKVRLWQKENQSLFAHFHIEGHLNAMFSPIVTLRSGGYLVINQTEALVAIDVNSGKATSQRNIEETAFTTNQEAADEVARQLRLRDLAGLIVIDFIDMESRKHNTIIEQRLKDALRHDRARIQIGSISHFGLLEMSRQRLRPSVAETAFSTCSHCNGTGVIRSIENSALHVLRIVEEESARRRSSAITVHVSPDIALYILNNKRSWLTHIEQRHHMEIQFAADSTLASADVRIKRRSTTKTARREDLSEEPVENIFTDPIESIDPENAYNVGGITKNREKPYQRRRREPNRGSREKTHEDIATQTPPQEDVTLSTEEDFLVSPQEDGQEISSHRNIVPNRRRTRYSRLRRTSRRQQYRTHDEEGSLPPTQHTDLEDHLQEGFEETSTDFSYRSTHDNLESFPETLTEDPLMSSIDTMTMRVDYALSHHDDPSLIPPLKETAPSQQGSYFSPFTEETHEHRSSETFSKIREVKTDSISEDSSPFFEQERHMPFLETAPQPIKTLETYPFSHSADPPSHTAHRVPLEERVVLNTATETTVTLSQGTENARDERDEKSKPVIQPIVIEERPPTEQRRTGWWKR